MGNYHIAVSEFTGKRLINYLKVNPKKVAVIPNGVDFSKLHGKLSDKIHGRIVYVGRLVPHKHVELLVDAFKKIKKEVPYAELHVVGSGPLFTSLKNQASAVKDCFIHGFLREDEMQNLLKTSWVFVLPSEREGSSIVALEALAARVPVITVNSPDNAAKELAQFGCCLVTEPNSKSIASTIIGLFNDEGIWTDMSQNALRFAEKYDWDTVAAQMEVCMSKMVCNA
jgi:glycosyltransferase involved in cell wall biosynthesis